MEDIENDLEKLGDLELDELGTIINFADNMATKLAYETSTKLKNVGKKSK